MDWWFFLIAKIPLMTNFNPNISGKSRSSQMTLIFLLLARGPKLGLEFQSIWYNWDGVRKCIRQHLITGVFGWHDFGIWI